MRHRAMKPTLAALAAVLLWPLGTDAGGPQNIPANKTAVSVSKVKVLEGTKYLANPPLKTTLLSETVKTPNNGDLVAYFTTECFIGSYDIDSDFVWGFVLDGRRAAVKVWVEVDGERRSPRINICSHGIFQLDVPAVPNQVFAVELEKFGGAYAFNFPILGLSNGTHHIAIKAKLEANVLNLDGIPDEGIIAVIGARSLIVDPIKVRVGETLGDDTPY